MTNRRYKMVVQPISGFDVSRHPEHKQELYELVEYDDLILYKIHGTFHQEGARDLILTEEDYIEFLTVASIKDKGVPAPIADKLVDSTLLFLGYGLEDWDFRVIFHALIGKLPPREKRKSFAIQKRPSEFWGKYWSKPRRRDLRPRHLLDASVLASGLLAVPELPRPRPPRRRRRAGRSPVAVGRRGVGSRGRRRCRRRLLARTAVGGLTAAGAPAGAVRAGPGLARLGLLGLAAAGAGATAAGLVGVGPAAGGLAGLAQVLDLLGVEARCGYGPPAAACRSCRRGSRGRCRRARCWSTSRSARRTAARARC